MNFLNKSSLFLNKILVWIAGTFLTSMILLTCANIAPRVIRAVFRSLFTQTGFEVFERIANGLPAGVPGTFELMGFFGAIVTAFALGDTQNKRGHIAVNVLINTFPKKLQKVLNVVNNTICMLFFGIATWQLFIKATILQNSGEVSETLRIIYYPFTYSVAFGCAVLSLVFLTDLMKSLFGIRGVKTKF
jgi:TRAP-type C4-dicarboxylate transport system permease small subunit